MWQLENPTNQRVKLDFSYSGQSSFLATQLWDADIQIINMIEYVNWGESPLQFMVCSDCGFVGCAPHGWVEIKRAGDLALIMPTFTKIGEAFEIVNNEYLPPYYLLNEGAIYIAQEIYSAKFCCLANFPSFEELALLNSWESAKIFQLEAPNYILGDISTPIKFNQDVIIASSKGDYREQAKEINSLVNRLSTNTQLANLRRATEQDQIISFYLDIAGVPEWKALSYNGSRYSLYLEPGYVIE